MQYSNLFPLKSFFQWIMAFVGPSVVSFTAKVVWSFPQHIMLFLRKSCRDGENILLYFTLLYRYYFKTICGTNMNTCVTNIWECTHAKRQSKHVYLLYTCSRNICKFMIPGKAAGTTYKTYHIQIYMHKFLIPLCIIVYLQTKYVYWYFTRVDTLTDNDTLLIQKQKFHKTPNIYHRHTEVLYIMSLYQKPSIYTKPWMLYKKNGGTREKFLSSRGHFRNK